MKTIQCRNIHDVSAPKSDELNGRWHKGERLEQSETVAFYFKRDWWASVPGLEKVIGPCEDKHAALRGVLAAA